MKKFLSKYTDGGAEPHRHVEPSQAEASESWIDTSLYESSRSLACSDSENLDERYVLFDPRQVSSALRACLPLTLFLVASPIALSSLGAIFHAAS